MINSLKVLLDEDELTKIYRCFLDQYRIIKKEKLEREREAKG